MNEGRHHTSNKAAYTAIVGLNRLYAMLCHINRTIVRVNSPSDLYIAACRIMVEEGNLRFAIIALKEPRVSSLVPVAAAGESIDLHWLPVCNDTEATNTLPQDTFGCLEQPCVINDVHTDKRTSKGRLQLEDAGVMALATIPLHLEQNTVGIMSVGVGKKDYFGQSEIRILTETAGDISFAIELLHRDEERLASKAKMHYLTYYDPRTGLPGRRLLEDRLTEFCRQHPNAIVVVMVINLLNYHEVMRAIGYHAGIIIVRTIASRIERMMPTATVACIGESEFAISLESQEGLHEIEAIAWRIHRKITEAIIIDRQEVFIGAFLGISIFPKDGSPIEVVNAAFTATDRAPLDSSSCCRFYVSGMDKKSRKRLTLGTALHRAASRQEFELHYQPQVDLASGRVIGAEALLRWRHPDLGLIQPSEFIPMLEETGLICNVGEWALAEACTACRRWQDKGIPPVRVAVNLSGRQFRDTNIAALVRHALNDVRLSPHWLELEVTESMILPNANSIIQDLRELQAIGVSQALDDFGTGYSSLSYLQRLPVQRLKIDRSFVSNITSNPSDAAIVRAVVSMAHSLNIKVIAEGVETVGQLGYLHDLACDEMQGFHFSPPLCELEFTDLLRHGHSIRLPYEQQCSERVLLLVDDDPNILSAMRRMLKRTNIHVLTTTNVHEGFDLLATHPVGVVICDQRMPEMTGTEFLRRSKELFPATVRIVLSGFTDLNSVIDAVNRGAIFKFLTKPLKDDSLLESVESAFHLHEIEQENHLLTRQLHELTATTKPA